MIDIELSPLELDPASGLSRVPPRPEQFRQPSYEEEFDRYTVLYDLFWSADDRHLVGIGPPLANLADTIVPVLERGVGGPLDTGLEHRSLDRISQLWLRYSGAACVLPQNLFKQNFLQAQPNHHHLFRGKKVALVKSKDNLLSWIKEWAYFAAKGHGCNAILFYDNGSTAYSTMDVQQTLASVPGIDTALVIAWPYKFGAQGGPHDVWDSDFCQYGILEHARHRFLARAHSVLQTDIDELVLTEQGESVFDLVSRSATGHIRFDGRWIDSATPEQPDPASRLHRHYRHVDTKRSNYQKQEKWAVLPQRCPPTAQWCVHWISGMTPDPITSRCATYRHFKAINTNWRDDRGRPNSFKQSRHLVDVELARWMRMFEDVEVSQAGPQPRLRHASTWALALKTFFRKCLQARSTSRGRTKAKMP